MLALAALVGGGVVVQAHRIQPEAARLAPQLDAAAMGVQQVPAITLDAMRGLRSEDKTPDPWGIRDAPKGLVSDSVADHGQADKVQADLHGQAGTAQGFSTMAVADVESLLDEEIKELRGKLTEATALKTKFYSVGSNLKALKGKLAEVDSAKQKLDDVTVEILKVDPDNADTAQLDKVDEQLARVKAGAEKLDLKPPVEASVEVEKKTEETQVPEATQDNLDFFKEDLEKTGRTQDQIVTKAEEALQGKPDDPKTSEMDASETAEKINKNAADGFIGI